eukprot:TRINITY_DN9921_c0_g1_i1.p1 TRINITY_DN9921_c0_g1~~TRINITY_DN9921_c0_g1_i1.p1  ORF type:complete len:219 (+),score=45.13 TRINITY_DN9921_c0_g1_i1:24-680(+)
MSKKNNAKGGGKTASGGFQIEEPEDLKIKPVEQPKVPKKSENNSINQSSEQVKPEFQSVDTGTCLSMWQPWASLVVHGIKKVEGRSWPTDYRGRLWIHSASKQLEPEVLEHVEEQYKRISRDTAVFPPHYPTSVLLGCVDLIDCINQAQFHAIKSTKTAEELLTPENDWLNDENESEWLYVCTNPRVLPMPLAVSGEHKLWKLTKKIHTAAKMQLNLN